MSIDERLDEQMMLYSHRKILRNNERVGYRYM